MRFSSRLLLASNRLFPPKRRHATTEADYFRHTHSQARERHALFAKHVDFAGKSLLDIGCGFGGKSIFYARETPVDHVVGVDLISEKIEKAKAWAAHEKVDPARLRFEVGDGSRMPFADATFDLLLSEDMIEHVVDVPGFLTECWRVLKPGGALLMRGGPLARSPWGGHLYYQFGLPWVGLIFSQDAIREASSQLPPPDVPFLTMTPAQEIVQFEELNRLTLPALAHLVDQAGFERSVWVGGPLKLWLLQKIPAIGSLFTASITAVLRKRSA